jgi:O-antigen/teichoic acid export membrane protein
MVALVFSTLIHFVLNFSSIHLYRRQFNLNFNLKIIDKESLFILLNYTIPTALSSFVVVPTFWFLKSLIVKFDGFEKMAEFEVADQWRLFLLFIPITISQFLLPLVSGMLDKKSDVKIIFSYTLAINFIATFFLFIVMYYIGKPLLLLYGENYSTGLFTILCFSTIFSALSNVLGQYLGSVSKMWVGLVFNLFWAVLVIFLTLTLSASNSYSYSSAYSILIASSILAFLQMGYVWYHFNLK